MVSVAIKHMETVGSGTGRHILVSRVTGASGGEVEVTRKHYDLRVSYLKDEANGSTSVSVAALFPSGDYSALDYTPVWSGHRFLGWFAEAAVPTQAANVSGTAVAPSDPVVCGRAAVYARWQLPHSVTLDADGGTVSGGSTVQLYEGAAVGSLPAASKEGLFFEGWLDGNGNAVAANSVYAPSMGETFTAQYGTGASFRYLRLHITKTRGAGGVMQLSRVDLLDSSDATFAWPSGTTVYDTPDGYNAKGYGNGELPVNLVDGSVNTKLCCSSGIGSSQTRDYSAYFDLGAGNAVNISVFSKWRWYTANDSSERDPVSFALYGSNDNATWELLDSATNATITTSRKALAYTGNLAMGGAS